MRIGYHFHVPVGVGADPADLRYLAHYAMFLDELAKRGHAVTLFAPCRPAEETETHRLDTETVRVVDLGPPTDHVHTNLRPGVRIERFLRGAADLDALIVRGPTPLLPHLLRARPDLPTLVLLVADQRNWRPSRVNGALKNAAIRLWSRWYRHHQVRATSRAHVAAISRSILEGEGYRRTSVVVTSSTTTAEVAQFEAARAPWPDGRGRTSPARMLFTGRFTEEKGLFELVQAMADLVARGYDLVLELVGYGSSDPTEGLVLAAARDLGLEDRIERTGFLAAGPDLFDAYRRADIYVLPTHGEGSVPRTVKEAMVARLPVVTTRIPAITEFLTSGREAVLVEPHDPRSLADGIASVIDDPGLRDRIGAGGRTWAAALTNERSVDTILELLDAITDESFDRPED